MSAMSKEEPALVRFRGEASRVLLILRKCQKQLPRYLPREIVPRTASSRAQLSAVIATVFDMTVRPLPDPALRPAPLRWPPWFFLFCIGDPFADDAHPSSGLVSHVAAHGVAE